MRLKPRAGRRRKSKFRTIPVKGFGEDKGRWFRCANCNFTCDVERDELGDADTVSTIGYIEFTPTTYPTEGGLKAVSMLGGGSNVHVSLEIGAEQTTILETLEDVSTTGIVSGESIVSAEPATADGNAKGIYYYLKPVHIGGCPLCKTRNWRGDY